MLRAVFSTMLNSNMSVIKKETVSRVWIHTSCHKSPLLMQIYVPPPLMTESLWLNPLDAAAQLCLGLIFDEDDPCSYMVSVSSRSGKGCRCKCH